MTTLPEKDAGDPTGVPYPFRAPKMQMYLFTGNGSSGTYDVNGIDDAAIVYHEYTHGLSNRLVDPQGTGGLSSKQGGAMGEAWSDWYAMDYLNAQGLQPDLPSTPDVAFGAYEHLAIRTQPMDCPVAARTGSPPGPADASCPGGHAPWYGGYTYGDFAKISSSGAEVHADGEIWGETLWQLRSALIQAHGTATGQFRARALITDGMRLSSPAPTFLSMRDSILQANGADGFGTADCRTIWGVFANRGMGSDATTTGSNDTSPHAGFSDPSGSAAFCPTGAGTTTTPGAAASPATPGAQPAAPAQPAPSRPAKPRFTGSAASVRVSSSGRFAYSFRATPALTGRVTFPTVSTVRVSRRARITLAAATFAVPPSGRVTVRPRLSRERLQILKRHRSMKVRATIVVKTIFGLSSQATRTLTLKAPRSTR